MNIFVLDRDPVRCAEMHCDQHIVCMVKETAQILCTALSNRRGNDMEFPYRPTHRNHPCVKWAEDIRHWLWLRNLGFALAAEYTHRYGKVHKSLAVIESFTIPQMTLHMPTEWALCMPEQYKTDDVVDSYRSFYRHKPFRMTWRNRDVPEWFPFPHNQSLFEERQAA